MKFQCVCGYCGKTWILELWSGMKPKSVTCGDCNEKKLVKIKEIEKIDYYQDE